MTTYNVEIVVNGQDRASGPLGKVGSALGRVGEIAGGVIASQIFMQAGQAIWNFASSSLGAASDLNESYNKVQQIFGESFSSVVGWADKAAVSTGLSKKSALDAASTFAVFGSAAGLAGGDLEKFGESNTQLAADLASFYNTSVPDAVNAIGAAFRGESEPIRRYGVMMDDATLKNEAFKLGIISSTKTALTPQQRVLAAQQVILAQTSAAQGDFGRTSEGLANQQRILAAQVENAKEKLGSAFLPVATQVMGWLNTEGVAAMDNIIGRFQGVAQPVLNFKNVLDKFGPSTAVVSTLQGVLMGLGVDVTSQPIMDFLETVRSGVDALPAKFEAFRQMLSDAMSSEPVQNLINSFSNLPAKFDALKQGLADAMKSEPVQNLLNGFSGFVSFITTQWPPILKIIQDVGTVLMDALGPVVVAILQGLSVAVGWLAEKFAQLGEWFSANGPLITEVLNIVGQDLIARWRLLGAAFQYIMQKAGEMWAFIEPLFNGLVSFILGTVQAIMLAITGNWAGAWQALQIASAQLMIGIITAIIGFFDWIASFFGSSLTEISNIWSQNWSMFTQIVSTIWGNITSAISNGIAAVLSYLINKAAAFIEAGRVIMASIIIGIKNSVSNMTSAVSTFVGNILSTIGNTALKFAELGGTLARNIVNGVTGAIGSVTDAVRNGISNALGGLGNIIGGFTSIGSDIIANIISGINNAGSKVVDTLMALVKDAIDAIKKSLGILPGGGAKSESARVLESAFTANLNPALQTPSGGTASAGFGAGGSQSWSTSSAVANYFGPVTIANQSTGSPLELLQTMR